MCLMGVFRNHFGFKAQRADFWDSQENPDHGTEALRALFTWASWQLLLLELVVLDDAGRTEVRSWRCTDPQRITLGLPAAHRW